MKTAEVKATTRIKRTHTKEQNQFLEALKFKYLTASTKYEQDTYAALLANYEYF